MRTLSRNQESCAMTRTRKIVAWSCASFVLLIAVVVLVLVFFDWNRIKPPINAKVSEELHRPFAINGNLAVVWAREPDEGGWRAWVPWPHVIAEDLTLGNPDWSKKPQMVTLKRVELRISPLALLAQRVVIPRIDLTEPSADLQRLADGRANWTFKFDPKDPNAEPSSWVVDIGAIGFDKGHVTLDDQTLKSQLDVIIDPLGNQFPSARSSATPMPRRPWKKVRRLRTTRLASRSKGSTTARNSRARARSAACSPCRTRPSRSRCRPRDRKSVV